MGLHASDLAKLEALLADTPLALEPPAPTPGGSIERGGGPKDSRLGSPSPSNPFPVGADGLLEAPDGSPLVSRAEYRRRQKAAEAKGGEALRAYLEVCRLAGKEPSERVVALMSGMP